MGQQRSNMGCEAAVDRGLAVAENKGWLAGAKQMHDEGVPLHVAARVMLLPDQRRSKDASSTAEH